MRMCLSELVESRWDPVWRDLVASIAGDSAAWSLVFDLANLTPERRDHSDSEIESLLEGRLTGRAPDRRDSQESESIGQIGLVTDWLDESGRPDPARLAAASRPDGSIERRTTQDEMVRSVRSAFDAGRDGF